MKHNPHIDRAIRLHGTQAELARATGYTQKAISWALRRGVKISAEMAIAIHKATSGKVHKKTMRPDLF